MAVPNEDMKGLFSEIADLLRELIKVLKYREPEDYITDFVNRKYAGRINRKIDTEHERLVTQGRTEPGKTEYEWMLQRALEIHRELNLGENKNEKGTENPVGVGGGKSA